MSGRHAVHQRNIAGLRAAAARKHQEAGQKVDDAIRTLLQAGKPITFRRVAICAGVSTGWLYAQPDVKERIIRMRGQSVRTQAVRAERASDASKDAIMRALRQQVEMLGDQRKELLARIKQLEERIEILYGELYAKRPGDRGT
jgi:hypothetical protein